MARTYKRDANGRFAGGGGGSSGKAAGGRGKAPPPPAWSPAMRAARKAPASRFDQSAWGRRLQRSTAAGDRAVAVQGTRVSAKQAKKLRKSHETSARAAAFYRVVAEDAKSGRYGKGAAALRASFDARPKLSTRRNPNQNVDYAQHRALEGYKSVNFAPINGALRRGDRLGGLRDTVRQIDSAARGNRTRRDQVLYRGISVPTRGNPSSLVGQSSQTKTYMSTTTSKRLAREYAGQGGTVMRVRVKAGTPAVHMEQFNRSKVNTNEGETLIGRGVRQRIVGARRMRNGQTLLDVVIEPKPRKPRSGGKSKRKK